MLSPSSGGVLQKVDHLLQDRDVSVLDEIDGSLQLGDIVHQPLTLLLAAFLPYAVSVVPQMPVNISDVGEHILKRGLGNIN